MTLIRDIEGWEGAMRRAKIITYDRDRYKFAEIFASIFGVPDVSRLHCGILAKKRRSRGPQARLDYKDSRGLRDWLSRRVDDSCFYRVYHPFIYHVVIPYFNNKVAYAQRPHFRVHLAGGPSVSNWHRDTDITGRFDQITAWIPVVDCSGTNSLWVESDYGKRDYRPVTVQYGEVLLFDGGLFHGSASNQTDISRIGFDLRFAPLATHAGADLEILADRPAGFEDDRREGARSYEPG